MVPSGINIKNKTSRTWPVDQLPKPVGHVQRKDGTPTSMMGSFQRGEFSNVLPH